VSSSGQKRALEQPSDRSFDRSPHFVPTVTTRGVSAQRSHDAIQRESDRSLPANSGLAHPTVARCCRSLRKSLHRTEARAGIEPANSGFAVLSEPLRPVALVRIHLRLQAFGADAFCIALHSLAFVCQSSCPKPCPGYWGHMHRRPMAQRWDSDARLNSGALVPEDVLTAPGVRPGSLKGPLLL
jgi:hypothetical protein